MAKKNSATSSETPDHVIGLQKQIIPRWKQNVRKKVRNVIRFGTKQTRNPDSHIAQPFQRNSVTNVPSDSKGNLYLEKYILRQNLTLSSRDVVDNRTRLSVQVRMAT